MKEYVLNGNRERILPNEVRQQCIWIVRDIERLKNLAIREVENERFGPYEIIMYADDKEGLISAAVIHDAAYKINSINQAISTIPKEYRAGVLNNILNRIDFDDFASENTWNLWKDRFIHNLAKCLNLC